MSDEFEVETIVGFANGLPVYEQRTAHGADGKFVSGAGGGMAHAAGKAAKHYQSKADKEAHPERKKAFQASADAYRASERAHTSGAAHDHTAAHAAHEHAQKLHSAIHSSSEHGGSVKGHHGREAAGHGLALKDHSK